MDLSEINFHTFGCKVNSYDTGLLEKNLSLSKFERTVHVLNTCAVTAEATREAVRSIKRLKKKNPDSIVVVTGCSAQVDTESFVGLQEADLVVANSHKTQLPQIIEDFLNQKSSEKIFKSNIFKIEDLGEGGGKNSLHTRSFLKIQDGCNSFCTYCVIPFARGKSRSIPIDQIVDKVHELYDQGMREVVVTGIHIGDYQDVEFGESKARGLEDLIEQLLIRTKMPRFRVSSLEPPELTPRLLELYSVDRMCPHFHMSIQSATDSVLFGMKRQYGQTEVQRALREIGHRLKNAYVGMDVIVGFPGESERDFQETYEVLKDLPWTKIHVFPYSERPNTFAQRLSDKNNQNEIIQRARFLRDLSQSRLKYQAEKQLGSVKKGLALVSKQENESLFLSRDYWNIKLEEVLPVSQEEIDIKITDFYAQGEKAFLIGQKYT